MKVIVTTAKTDEAAAANAARTMHRPEDLTRLGRDLGGPVGEMLKRVAAQLAERPTRTEPTVSQPEGEWVSPGAIADSKSAVEQAKAEAVAALPKGFATQIVEGLRDQLVKRATEGSDLFGVRLEARADNATDAFSGRKQLDAFNAELTIIDDKFSEALHAEWKRVFGGAIELRFLIGNVYDSPSDGDSPGSYAESVYVKLRLNKDAMTPFASDLQEARATKRASILEDALTQAAEAIKAELARREDKGEGLDAPVGAFSRQWDSTSHYGKPIWDSALAKEFEAALAQRVAVASGGKYRVADIKSSSDTSYDAKVKLEPAKD